MGLLVGVFVVLFLSVWVIGALYLLRRWLRFGKHGIFLGGRLLFEGPRIHLYDRRLLKLTIAVLASTNKHKPLALKFIGRAPMSLNMNIYPLSAKAAPHLRHLLVQAHTNAINDPVGRRQRVGSVPMLWLTLSVYARTKGSLVGIGFAGRAVAIPDDQYELLIQSMDSALMTAAKFAAAPQH